ncbi:hypothetical protein Xvie_00186 [Xenorhabdus vietnamensis]|uniref:Uncharacterized protein n=1 Tax=Xenorhabdus vietnamensis TaxID=351656 RepID=A0A1Y2SIX4_9GAMM|nr:hypothetical protein Xvie_00186 [Xenorhabdus vietnamensis]
MLKDINASNMAEIIVNMMISDYKKFVYLYLVGFELHRHNKKTNMKTI